MANDQCAAVKFDFCVLGIELERKKEKSVDENSFEKVSSKTHLESSSLNKENQGHEYLILILRLYFSVLP